MFHSSRTHGETLIMFMGGEPLFYLAVEEPADRHIPDGCEAAPVGTYVGLGFQAGPEVEVLRGELLTEAQRQAVEQKFGKWLPKRKT